MIKDISTNFPRYVTLYCTPDTIDSASRKEYGNAMLKVNFTCTAEEKKKFTQDDIGCMFGSDVKVVYSITDASHVRSAKIASMKTMEEKLREYLRINGIKDDGSLYPILKDIEDGMDISYSAPCHTFTLLKVEVRGAIGLMEGTGRNEYSVDFTRFTPGVVALCGDCGKGKSTLLENCQPYLKMLTRRGKLQDHFCLKDSYRKLLYIDEEGTYYSITIEIDGKNKNGKVRPFAATGKDMDNLTPVPDLDGNSGPYEEWVNETFGPVELYLRTAFYTKGDTGNIPDISLATKGEKKILFNSLLGLERLSAVSKIAKDRKSLMESEIDKLESGLEILDFNKEIEVSESLLESANSLINSCEAEIFKAEAELSTLGEAPEFKMEELNKRIIDNEKRRNRLADIRSVITEWESATERWVECEKASERLSKNSEELEETRTSLSETKSKYSVMEKELSILETECSTEFKYIERIVSEIPEDIDGSCPTCGQRLPEEELKKIRGDIAKRKSEVEELTAKLLSKKRKAEALALDMKIFKETQFDTAQNYMDALMQERKNLLPLAEEFKSLETLRFKACSVGDDYSEDEIVRLTEAIKSDSAKLEILKNDDSAGRMSELRNKLRELKAKSQEAMIDVGRYTNEIESLRQRKAKTEALRSKIGDLKTEAGKFETIEKAFGANGIQALELEAAAPDVAEITNSILSSAYGDKFRIKFVTLRDGASNNKVEDFSIHVENTETGTEKPLEWLSGGEGTWIKEALYHAFSVVRMRGQHAGFRTRFLDETDGSLDHDSKLRYLKMIQTAHEEGGSEVTVLITHSSELKDMIEQKIEL